MPNDLDFERVKRAADNPLVAALFVDKLKAEIAYQEKIARRELTAEEVFVINGVFMAGFSCGRTKATVRVLK